jgi:predicted PurR-regulated permease PerM
MGITSIIPFFGPFIGAVPCVLLMLLADPIQCLWFLILMIIIQQIDGNILAPKIIGDSTGLSSFWVIFGMLVGQGIFGFAGLIIGIPLFAVVYSFTKKRVARGHEEKNLPSDSND